MIRKFFATVLAVATAGLLSADSNLFRNTEFADGGADWLVMRAKALEKTPVVWGKGSFSVDLPLAKEMRNGRLQLVQRIRLEKAKEYVLTFTSELEKSATILVSYRTDTNPKRNLGIANSLTLPAGKRDWTLIVSPAESGNDRSEFCFQIGEIAGKVTLSDLRLQEFRQVPLQLADRWKLVRTDSPDFERIPAGAETIRRPTDATVGKSNRIDLVRKGERVVENSSAVLYNEFESDQEGFMRTGFSADWRMRVFLNGEEVYSTLASGNGTNSYSAGDHSVNLPVRKGRNLLAVQVLSGSAGWCLVWGTPIPPIKYEACELWQPVDMSSVHVQRGTALDLSGQIDAPAGKFGRAIVAANGLLAFEKQPEKNVRLHGFTSGIPDEIWRNCPDEEFRANATAFARAARNQGYNLFRMHGLDGWLCTMTDRDMAINPKYLDRWDYLISEMKKEGIYVQFVVLSFNLYGASSIYSETFAKRNMHKMLLYMGNEWERTRFRYGVETLMNHVNPYTGLAWKDDPAIVIVEYYNEEYLGMARYAEAAKAFPEDHKIVLGVWNDWLKKRYASVPESKRPAALRQGIVPIPNGRGELIDDYSLFCYEKIRETNRWCEKVIRDAGYKGLTTENSALILSSAAAGWETLQVVDNHVYFCHPSDWSKPGSRVGQQSAVEQFASYFRGIAAGRLTGRPQFIGEFNHCFWNPYQHELPMVFNLYAAYQNFSSLALHSHPVLHKGGKFTVGNFTGGTSPVSRAGQFLSNMLFLRGDVTPSPHLVALTVPEKFLWSDGNGARAVSSEQSKLALISGFGLAFPWAPTPEGITPGRKPDLAVLPTGAADVETHGWYTSVIETKDRNFSLADVVKEMKKRGILPRENLTDPDRGIFQTDTGEITMRQQEKLVKVVTPRTEAVTMLAGRSEPLGALEVKNSTADACIGATSIDGKPLAESDRIVLVYSTEMVNSGMELSGNRVSLIKLGVAPALMRTGTLELSLRNAGRGMVLYALAIDGTRSERLPLDPAVDGRLSIRIDTSKLAKGPTPFFELVRE